MLSRAYLDARHVRYSRFESGRVALLVARLALRDPPTDTWGRRIEANGKPPILRHDRYADPTQGRTIAEQPPSSSCRSESRCHPSGEALATNGWESWNPRYEVAVCMRRLPVW